ncbi:hypothetical protein [Actinocorallia sp. API 0066]|nr:hypothetical protein [Actinocorallia sp. API 0066]
MTDVVVEFAAFGVPDPTPEDEWCSRPGEGLVQPHRTSRSR